MNVSPAAGEEIPPLPRQTAVFDRVGPRWFLRLLHGAWLLAIAWGLASLLWNAR